MERGSGRIVENKKRPISWGYLVGSGYTVLSFLPSFFISFLFCYRRRREKGEKIFILESRDFEYLADKKRILIHDFELSVMIRQSLDYESLKRDKSFPDLILLKMRLF